MDGYKVGDISSLLNSSTSEQKATNDLFSKETKPALSVEEVYVKPFVKPAKGKRPKKNKPIEPEPEPEASKFPSLSPEEKLEIDKRTLFVGNLPLGYKRKQLRKLFAGFGKIQSLRFRSVAIADLKLGRKVCLKTNKVNENATCKNAYIVFDHEGCLEEALSKNGILVNDHHIRVDRIVKSKQQIKDDSKNSIFIGNIPFAASEEDIRLALEQCGEIEYVRLLRDSKTNIGKGFGYVKFADSSGVMFAMKIKDTVEVNGRKLRIQRCKSKVTLENTKKAKELKTKQKDEANKSFRGRKSKSSDKDIFSGKVNKSKNKKFDSNKRPSKRNKQKTMSKQRFDKKVNKASKKGGIVNKGKKEKQ
ncbi:hypothetical protein ACHWQZ_G017420 [Mnemiopsis leidyi]